MLVSAASRPVCKQELLPPLERAECMAAGRFSCQRRLLLPVGRMAVQLPHLSSVHLSMHKNVMGTTVEPPLILLHFVAIVKYPSSYFMSNNEPW